MKKFKIVLASLIMFSIASVALAATVVAPSQNDPNVFIGSGDSYKNLYTAGANVTINNSVAGDLTVAGGMVNLVGDVEQELLAVGGTLNISGKVGGHARLAGGNINITAPINGDAVAAGGNINFTEKAAVGGDLLAAGGNIVLGSPVKGNLKIAGGNITIDSKVEGNVEVVASKGLVFGPRAEVRGRIIYKGPTAAVVEAGAKISNIEFTLAKQKDLRNGLWALLTFAIGVKFLALLITAWLFLAFRRKTAAEILRGIKTQPMAALGWGLVFCVVPPVIILVLFATLIGYYLAFILLACYVLMLMLAGLVGVLLVGNFVLDYFYKTRETHPNWQVVLLGVILYMIIWIIPLLGALVIAVLFLMSVGGIFQAVREKIKE